LAGEGDGRVIVFSAEHHVRDVAEPNHGAALLADHEVLELVDRAQIRVCREVDLHERALGLAHGGQVVVVGERLPHLHRAHVERRQPVRL